jgi:hypothetical protein
MLYYFHLCGEAFLFCVLCPLSSTHARPHTRTSSPAYASCVSFAFFLLCVVAVIAVVWDIVSLIVRSYKAPIVPNIKSVAMVMKSPRKKSNLTSPSVHPFRHRRFSIAVFILVSVFVLAIVEASSSRPFLPWSWSCAIRCHFVHVMMIKSHRLALLTANVLLITNPLHSLNEGSWISGI